MISVIVPVFNEEGNILVLLKKIKKNLSSEDEIIVVDDGSNDGTINEIKDFDCKLIKHDINLGKGQSLIDGVKNSSGDIILFIDGDGQDNPDEIHKLIEGINKGFDFVIGSRFIPEISSSKKRYDQNALSPVNFVGNKILTFLINKIFNLNIFDTQSGFKCFKAEKLKKLELVSKRYEIETEIIIKSKRNNFNILEVPVYRYERKKGVSNLFDVPFGRMRFMLRVIRLMIYSLFIWK